MASVTPTFTAELNPTNIITYSQEEFHPTRIDSLTQNSTVARVPSSTDTSLASPLVETSPASDPQPTDIQDLLRRTSVRPDIISSKTPKVTGIQKWEGRILEVDGDVFTAELTPMDENAPTIVGDFEVALLDNDPDEEVVAGDTFYLTVRTVRDRGAPTRTSSLRRRRLGRWSEEELSNVRARARKRLESFKDYAD